MNEFENAFEIEEEKECCCGCKCSPIWKTVALILIGVVIGFLISPIKHGTTVITENENVVVKGGKKKKSKKKNKKKSECEEK